MNPANENKSTFNIVALVGQQKTSVFAEVFLFLSQLIQR